MSTQHVHSQTFSPPPPVGAMGAIDEPAIASGAETSLAADSELVQQTKHQIRTLVQEIAQLSQSDATLEDFYDGFLQRVVSALACAGGAIWTLKDGNSLELRYQINLPRSQLADIPEHHVRHSLLLKKILGTAVPALIQPHSGPGDDEEAGNPTEFLLVLAPIKAEQQVQAVVEIFQRAGGGPTTHRGYLRFLVQMCDLAGEFLKNRRLRSLHERQTLWEQLESFIRLVHGSLEPRETAFTIVNDGRRLMQCDRVSVAFCRGRQWRIEAVSGLDTLDRRAAQIKLLGKLATAVARAGRPLWYSGDASELPPQIEEALQQYLDQSHAKTVAVLPLRKPLAELAAGPAAARQAGGALPAGVLIVEQLQDSRLSDALRNRIEVVAGHSADALTNALEHHNLLLMPLWRALGKAKWIVRARNLPKTALAAVVGGLILAVLTLVPVDFELSARGTLRPQVRRDIFAAVDGVLVDVPVEHAQFVEVGQVLARLRNTDLEVEIATIIGRKTATQEQILSLQRALLDSHRLNPDEQNRLSGELAQLLETADSLNRQWVLYREKERQLIITSPQTGQVVTWQVRDTLLQRPVQRGQSLMTIVDPSGEWELELLMPEHRMGHIAQAESAMPEGLRVTFMMAMHPGQHFEGRVVEIERAASVRGAEGNTVLIRVAVEKAKLPQLRDGSQATARIHCGRRPVGFVLMQDVIETVQAKILFWL